MPQNLIPPQEPSQFPGSQLPQQENRRMLWVVGIVVAIVFVGGIAFVLMMFSQGQPAPVERAQQQIVPSTEAARDPVERVSGGTTVGDIQADLNALNAEANLPDLDAETQALERETQGF